MEVDNKTSKRKIFLSRSALRKPSTPPGTYNIFETSDCASQQESSLDNISLYHVVGDSDFRTKLIINRTNKRQTPQLRNMNVSLPSSTVVREQTLRKSVFDKTHLTLKDTSKLVQPSEVNYMGRCRKVKNALQKYKSGWNQFNETIRTKFGKPCTNQSEVRVVIQDNPEKGEIIKQVGCEYWKKSLRNNDKKLLKYFQGAPHKRNDILRLLQTSEGERILKSSIPVRDGQTPKQGFVVEAVDSQHKRTVSLNGGIGKYKAEEVFRSTWKNKDLSRLYQL